MLLEKAMKIAEEALKSLKNEDGTPYYEHALRVMERMDTENEKIVAVLHDVLEDTSVQLVDLKEAGFTGEILECLDQLRRRSDMTYFEYIEDVATNPVTAKIKLAELDDNQDVFRVKKLSFQTFSIEERVKRARKILLDAENR